jgi:hypothetical protein
VGLAAWLLDHDTTSCDQLAELFAGKSFGAITRDDILDNTSLYWFTNTATSARPGCTATSQSWPKFLRRRRPLLPDCTHSAPGGGPSSAAQLDREGVPHLIYFNEAERVVTSRRGSNRNCFRNSCALRSARGAEGAHLPSRGRVPSHDLQKSLELRASSTRSAAIGLAG